MAEWHNGGMTQCRNDTPAEAGALPKEKAQKDEAAPEVSSQERKEISKAK